MPNSVFALAATGLQLPCVAMVRLESQHDAVEYAAYSRIYGARYPMAATGATIPILKGSRASPQYPTGHPSQDTTRPRSRETSTTNRMIGPRPDRHLDSSATEAPAQSQRDATIQATNPAAPRPHEAPRRDAPSDTETGAQQITASGSNSQRGDSSIEKFMIAIVMHVQDFWGKTY